MVAFEATPEEAFGAAPEEAFGAPPEEAFGAADAEAFGAGVVVVVTRAAVVVTTGAEHCMHVVPSRDTCRSLQSTQLRGPLKPALREDAGHTQSSPTAFGTVPGGQVVHARLLTLKM